jgi:hypothetical protein
MTDLVGSESTSNTGSSPSEMLVGLKSRRVGGGSASNQLPSIEIATAVASAVFTAALAITGIASSSNAGTVGKSSTVGLNGQSIQSALFSPVVDAPTVTVRIGGNVAGTQYYETEPLLVNMVQQGFDVFTVATGGSGGGGIDPCPVDPEGWPTVATFRVRPHNLKRANVQQDMLGQFTGFATSITLPVNDNSRYTVLNGGVPTYVSGTNTSTFTLRAAAIAGTGVDNFNLLFNGAGRTGPGTSPGVTNIVLAHPGYTVADITTKVWTDEAVTYFRRFDSLRTMDMQAFNNAGIVGAAPTWGSPTWATSRRRATNHNQVTYEDMVDLANRSNVNLHMQIPLGFSDADVGAFADFVEGRLNSNLWIKLGSSNEDWNSAFSQFHVRVRQAAGELKGFVGTEGTRDFALSRSGTTVTFTSLGDDHQWTNGQTVYFTSIDGGNPQPAVTVTGPKTATFTYAGTGLQGALTVNSGQRVIGELNSTLRLGSTLAADSIVDVYPLAQRYRIRRTKEISDLVRARPTIGDAKMGIRWRIVWEDQMIANPDDAFADSQLRYLKTKWTARPVSGLTGYLYMWDGAPYFFATPFQETAGATQAQIVGALQANCVLAKSDYHFERRKAFALSIDPNLRIGCYEGGPDTKSNTLNGADLAVRCAAQFDPGIQAPIQTMLNDWFLAGGDVLEWYTLGFLQPTDQNRDQVWGVTDSIANLNTPKLNAFAAARASPPNVSRHLVPGTFDARTFEVGVYDSPGTYPNLGRANPSVVRGLVYASVAGNYTLRVRYTCNQPGMTANIFVNDGVAIPVSFVNQGTGITHDTLRGTNGAGTIALADITIPLLREWNGIAFLRNGFQADWVELYSVGVL